MWILKADDLGKAYKAHRRPIDGLRESLSGKPMSPEAWVLRGVSFELRRGGSLGIVGDNGAGKSTLLRLLAGVIPPSEGRVQRSGTVSSMLQLGTGFHPDLTGIDNLHLGCAMLGLTPAESRTLVPDIVAFAELGEHIHRPLRTYSSGMALRLGFALAVSRQPDLLIVDEHLSVGDQRFRYKCLRRIADLRAAGCALVLCSHEAHALRETCEQTLWLKQGRMHQMGETIAVVNAYQSDARSRDESAVRENHAGLQAQERVHPADNWIDTANVLDDSGQPLDAAQPALVPHGGRLRIALRIRATDQAWRDGMDVGILLVRDDGLWCHGVSTRDDGMSDRLTRLADGAYGLLYEVPCMPLLTGRYSVTIALLDRGSPMVYDHAPAICSFQVTQACPDRGVVHIAHRWMAPP